MLPTPQGSTLFKPTGTPHHTNSVPVSIITAKGCHLQPQTPPQYTTKGGTPLTTTPGHYCPTHNRKPLPPLIILCCIFTWCNMNRKELTLRSHSKSKTNVTLYRKGYDTCWSAPLLYTADPPTLFACFFGIFGKIQKLCILD